MFETTFSVDDPPSPLDKTCVRRLNFPCPSGGIIFSSFFLSFFDRNPPTRPRKVVSSIFPVDFFAGPKSQGGRFEAKRLKLESYSVSTFFVQFLLPLGHRIRWAFSLKNVVWAVFFWSLRSCCFLPSPTGRPMFWLPSGPLRCLFFLRCFARTHRVPCFFFFTFFKSIQGAIFAI